MNEQKFCVRTPVWQVLLFLFFLLFVFFTPHAITQILKESVLTSTARIIFIVAVSIWCLFVFLFFLLQLDKSLTYIKVDGQTFLVRTGFRVKYNATCDDLKSIYISQLTELNTLNMYSLQYAHHSSINVKMISYESNI